MSRAIGVCGVVLVIVLVAGYLRPIPAAPDVNPPGNGMSPNDPIDCLYVRRLVVVDSKGDERVTLGFSDGGPRATDPNWADLSPELMMRDLEGYPIVQLLIIRSGLGQLRISGDVHGSYPSFAGVRLEGNAEEAYPRRIR